MAQLLLRESQRKPPDFTFPPFTWILIFAKLPELEGSPKNADGTIDQEAQDFHRGITRAIEQFSPDMKRKILAVAQDHFLEVFLPDTLDDEAQIEHAWGNFMDTFHLAHAYEKIFLESAVFGKKWIENSEKMRHYFEGDQHRARPLVFYM